MFPHAKYNIVLPPPLSLSLIVIYLLINVDIFEIHFLSSLVFILASSFFC